jgi:hypothetical protein
MSELAKIIEDLRNIAETIHQIVNTLEEQFSSPPATQPTQVSEPTLTLEEVRAILANKSRAGFTSQIRALLQKYGSDRLSNVDPAHYKALLADAEELTHAT